MSKGIYVSWPTQKYLDPPYPGLTKQCYNMHTVLATYMRRELVRHLQSRNGKFESFWKSNQESKFGVMILYVSELPNCPCKITTLYLCT